MEMGVSPLVFCVDDVVEADLSCLKADITIGKSYNIAEKHPLTCNEVIDTITKAMSKRV